MLSAFCLLQIERVFAAEVGGGDILFSDTKEQKGVTFSHKIHVEVKGNKCPDCHVKIFKMTKASTDKDNALTMQSINEGKFCGVCHAENKTAFSTSAKGACDKCHNTAK
ncbi:MAG: hypothetical protein HY999_00925 [Nitrospinae bacterium]|nr:hypothetical protein [Nitrospinota bacterium]